MNSDDDNDNFDEINVFDLVREARDAVEGEAALESGTAAAAVSSGSVLIEDAERDRADPFDSSGMSPPRGPRLSAALEPGGDDPDDLDTSDGLWPRLGLIVLAIMAFALVIRLADLGGRPLHHDEGLDAWFSWRFLVGTYEGYDPVYHGPLRFYITAGFYALFGESAAVARLTAALSGAVVVGMPWFWRRSLGNVATVGAAFLIAVSPSMLYFSRVGREDSFWLLLTAGTMFTLVGLVRRPRWWHPLVLFVLLVSAWAVKESTLLTIFLVGATGMAVLAQQMLFFVPDGKEPLIPAHHRTRVSQAMLLYGLLLMILAFFLGGNQHAFRNLALYGAALALPLFLGAANVIMGPKRLRSIPGGEQVLRAGAAVFALLSVAILAVAALGWITGNSKASGETTFIDLDRVLGHVLFIALTAAAVAALVLAVIGLFEPGSGAGPGARLAKVPLLRSLGRPGWAIWGLALALGTLLFVAFFTKFFTTAQGATSPQAPFHAIWDGVRAGYDYWMGEQKDKPPRGDNRWQYYLTVIPAYEWFGLGLAAVGTARVFKRPTLIHQVIFWWGCGSFIIHSWAKEKMPWLIIHPLFPLLILAGIGVSVLWDRRSKAWAPPVAMVGLAALVFTMFTSYQAAYVRGGEQAELFVQAGQAAPDVPEWVDRMRQLNRLATSTWGTEIKVAIDDDVFWPYGFYLRDDAYASFTVYTNESTEPPDADVIIMSGFDLPQLEQQILDSGQDYVRLEYTHRWWWVPDYTDAGVSGWLKWVWNREIWDADQSPPGQAGKGELNGAVLIRRELLDLETAYNTSIGAVASSSAPN